MFRKALLPALMAALTLAAMSPVLAASFTFEARTLAAGGPVTVTLDIDDSLSLADIFASGFDMTVTTPEGTGTVLGAVDTAASGVATGAVNFGGNLADFTGFSEPLSFFNGSTLVLFTLPGFDAAGVADTADLIALLGDPLVSLEGLLFVTLVGAGGVDGPDRVDKAIFFESAPVPLPGAALLFGTVLAGVSARRWAR